MKVNSYPARSKKKRAASKQLGAKKMETKISRVVFPRRENNASGKTPPSEVSFLSPELTFPAVNSVDCPKFFALE